MSGLEEKVTEKVTTVGTTQPPSPVVTEEKVIIPFVEVMKRNDKLADAPPIDVRLRFNRNCEHETEVVETLAKLQEIYNLNRKFIICFDAIAVTHAERSHLLHLKKFLQINQEVADKNTVAVAIVLPTKGVKLLMQGVLLFRKTPFEIKVFKELQPAKDWLKQQREKFVAQK